MKMRIECKCVGCGAPFSVTACNAKRGRGKYCSVNCSVSSFVTRNTKRPPLRIGDRFHMLTLVEPIARGRYPTWRVKCDCGTEKITVASRFGGKRPLLSCGCYRRPREGNPNALHRHKLYGVFRGIIARTNNPNDHLYGGRGIKVCDRWRHGDDKKSGFECFLVDMGPRPSAKHSIDRKDNEGDYKPSNCRWATAKEQARNRRQNIFVEISGERLCLLDAVSRLNPPMDYGLVLGRIDKGWPFDKAISLPKMPGKPLRKRVA